LLFSIATVCPAVSPRPAAAVQAVGEGAPTVSADRRFVAYTAAQGDHSQIFVRDTCQGGAEACQSRTLLVSSATDGALGNDDSLSPSMSADGRYIAFSSAATNLLSAAPSGSQIYLRDTCLGARTPCTPLTQLISTDVQGALAGTEAILPSIGASGRFVTFVAVTPSPGANSRFRQGFVRDTCLATSHCTPTTVRTP
jgi:Tol biopolymer transport system component